MKTRFGLLLPHFGEYCDGSRVLRACVKAEELGFASVWVRDHIIFHPHAMESTGNNFLEPFTVLAAASSLTTHLTLGTAVITPLRHPLVTALNFTTLSQISRGRVIAGIGAGAFKEEFDALGYPFDERASLVTEHIEVLKRVWRENNVSFYGKFFRFENVSINPKPIRDIPIWYGGTSPAAVERALNYCDGWLPGRINLPTFDSRLDKIERLSKASGRPRLSVGVMPITSIDKNKSAALQKINLEGLIDDARKQKWWKKPASGKFEDAEDLEGELIFGSPRDCCQQIEKYVQRGIDQLIFDLRFRFDEFDRCLTLLAKDVISSFI